MYIKESNRKRYRLYLSSARISAEVRKELVPRLLDALTRNMYEAPFVTWSVVAVNASPGNTLQTYALDTVVNLLVLLLANTSLVAGWQHNKFAL